MTTTTVRTLADLPIPDGMPVVGNLLPLAGPGRHHALAQWCDEHGSTFRLRVPQEILVTADPRMIDTMLRDRPGAFRRGARVSNVLDEMGAHGVFTAEGEEWRRLRRAATRSLSAAYINAYFTTLVRSTERLRRKWRTAAAAGSRVDVLDDMLRYTLDNTAGLAMGYDLNALESTGDGLHARLPEIFPEIGRRTGAPVPYWRWLPLPRHKRIAATLAELNDLVAERFAVAQQVMATGASPSNFLEALVAPLADEPALTRDELSGNVVTMLLAGEDTTAALAAWAVYYLATHPRVHRRVREEADRELGTDTIAADAGKLRRLQYAEAVVSEAVRLHPSAPTMALQAIDDVVLDGVDGPLLVPGGTTIFVLLTNGARTDADRFPDPDDFRPERWLDGGPPPPAPDAQPYLPFGGGPRFCPGRNLAQIEARLVVAMVAAEFDPVPETSAGPVTERSAFTVFPENMGLTLQARTR
ncbi:cytochrome P450 [Actinoplanes philippinensis]|uniref:Cytochrome P450 n=1 Tax=Actinoplanes philippinensis TaxID=35752 RepID=A0A1I2HG88_9ACTN|nr:cytochrome P450 [Actinoplanes philippinensis]GIE81758.1 cytochrome P450 [Actinoplanes philippinensis]SFF28548.1 Cytochrome P450 [Actinoplanes philippinensis]